MILKLSIRCFYRDVCVYIFGKINYRFIGTKSTDYGIFVTLYRSWFGFKLCGNLSYVLILNKMKFANVVFFFFFYSSTTYKLKINFVIDYLIWKKRIHKCDFKNSNLE